jgi:hypothetical protein
VLVWKIRNTISKSSTKDAAMAARAVRKTVIAPRPERLGFPASSDMGSSYKRSMF